ncbi:winged helix-turn-helix domain-containing protein [Thalassobaculum sp. OXR-137]|uniref:ArsR/SmtB family transcription factor n=1 Tax=Thalassobaculum sp. OXR-137 TaxID=3100173 RepID=UPI002AC980B8|nr:winged helix-turn-helix domain-containing protein [Thalassobaculum sp. OXR-137]WPZ35060.1 winged helix-turn-helix domain-containing protein [Thalassobaculum sp. OXR-137]
MTLSAKFELIGAALANESRARMLCALMDGRAFTNKELALAAGVSEPTATAHLRQLAEAGLTVSMRSGRSVYHRLASAEAANLLERLGGLTPQPYLHRARRSPGNADLLVARSCYSHIAGRLGVLLLDALVARGAIVLEGESVTLARPAFFASLGLSMPRAGPEPVRLCLDWTERRPHLSGPLGAALMDHALRSGWLSRGAPRVLTVTEPGYAALHTHFGLTREDIDHVPAA